MARRPVRAPPRHQSKRVQNDSDEKDEQRRLFEPAMNGAAVARKAPTMQKLPGPWAQSGHNAEDEQRQENAPQGVASDQPLTLPMRIRYIAARKATPLAELNRHHLEPSATRSQSAQPTATPRSALIGVVATQ